MSIRMRVLECLLGIYLIVGCFGGGLIQSMFSYFEKEKIEPFYFAAEVYSSLKDELNTAGVIICVAVVSVLCLPGSVLLIAVKFIVFVAVSFFQGFKQVFKKKTETKG